MEDAVVEVEPKREGEDEVIPETAQNNSLDLLRDVVVQYKMDIFNGISLKFSDAVLKQTKDQLELIYSIS